MAIANVKKRRTSDEIKFDQEKSTPSSLISITPDSAITEEFSLELTVGDCFAYVISGDNVGFHTIQGSLKLGRQQSVVIEVAEFIRMPLNLYGFILPTGRLFLGKGIIIAAAKIEPAYYGRLRLRLYNTSNDIQELKIGDPLASAIFFSTDSPTKKLPFGNSTSHKLKPTGKLKSALAWCKSNPGIFVSGFFSLLGSSVLAFFLSTYFSNRKIDFLEKKIEQMNQTVKELRPDHNKISRDGVLEKLLDTKSK